MTKVSLEKWAYCIENILQNKQYYFDAKPRQVSAEIDI